MGYRLGKKQERSGTEDINASRWLLDYSYSYDSCYNYSSSSTNYHHDDDDDYYYHYYYYKYYSAVIPCSQASTQRE